MKYHIWTNIVFEDKIFVFKNKLEIKAYVVTDTGEIKYLIHDQMIEYGELNEVYDSAEYNSLAELNDEWEDYEPVEPLIKDKHHPERAEKARKTLKMWADANGFKKVSYHVDSYVSVFYNEFNPAECTITIEFGWIMEGIKQGTYGITELCGEEEWSAE